jgi:succinyl-CoA synthetase beta subunit
MVRAFCEQMIGHTLVTKQTGPAGKKVSTVLIVERCDVQREMYFAITFDRTSGGA